MADNANTNTADPAGAGASQAAATGGTAPGGNGNVPMAVVGSLATDWANVVIGTNFIFPTPNPAPYNSYWFLVIDLTDLNVVANVASTSNSDVPSQLNPYVGNPQYLLILTTIGLTFDNLPVGALYSFLQSTGSGEKLEEAEQLFAQLGTGYFSGVGYILVATMNTADEPGFEVMQVFNQPLLLFQLMPVSFGGNTIYTPIKTGH